LVIKQYHDKDQKESEEHHRPVIDLELKEELNKVVLMFKSLKYIGCCPLENKPVIDVVSAVDCNCYSVGYEEEIPEGILIFFIVPEIERNNLKDNEYKIDVNGCRDVKKKSSLQNRYKLGKRYIREHFEIKDVEADPGYRKQEHDDENPVKKNKVDVTGYLRFLHSKKVLVAGC